MHSGPLFEFSHNFNAFTDFIFFFFHTKSIVDLNRISFSSFTLRGVQCIDPTEEGGSNLIRRRVLTDRGTKGD